MNKTFKTMIVVAAVPVMVAACSSAPKPNMALEEARQTYATVVNDPAVAQKAPLELQKAKDALDKSEALWRDKAKTVEVDHSAYLASQQAKIAQQTTRTKLAQDAITNAEAERSKALLTAREAQAREAEQRAQSAQSRAELLSEQVQDMQSQLEEAQKRKDMVLTLGSDIMFDTGKAVLKPGATPALTQIATFLNQNTNRSVLVIGHTDSTGSAAINDSLSLARANAVRDQLVSAGVSSNQVRTEGRGASSPIATNDTAAGRQQNRRVELKISNPSGTN